MPAVGKGLFWAKISKSQFLKACSELSPASKISQNIYMFKET